MLTIYIRSYSVMCRLIIGTLTISTLSMEEIVESINGKSHMKRQMQGSVSKIKYEELELTAQNKKD